MVRVDHSTNSLKLELSLASLMFFGPFIKHMIFEDSVFSLSDEDKDFVRWYTLLGFINLALWIITTGLWIASTFFSYQWISILFITFSISLLILLLGGSILALSNISLVKTHTTSPNDTISKDLEDSQDILLHYLPIMNFHIWYDLHDFDGTHDILKESQIIWTLFAGVCLIGNSRFISIFLILIIMRIVSLMILWNNTPVRWTNLITTLFKKNIEEVWGYLLGTIIRTIAKLFWSTKSLSTTQDTYKLPYSYLYDISKYSNIQWQYFLILVGTWYFLSTIPSWTKFWFIILGTGLLWGRYFLMAITWKHLPPIPIIDDIFRKVWAIFDKK